MEGNPFNKLQQLAQKAREEGTVNQSSSDIFKRNAEQKNDAPVSLEEAEKIFGKDFFGPKQVQEVFGAQAQEIPPIPFSKVELERAKELGQQLMYQVDTMRVPTEDNTDFADKKITFKNLQRHYRRVGTMPLWAGAQGFSEQEFFTTELPKIGWKLASKESPKEIKGENYLDQMDSLVTYLETVVYKDEPLSKEYAEAIQEFRDFKKEIPELSPGYTFNKEYSRELMKEFQKLKLVQLTQASPVEIAYQLVLEAEINKKILFHDDYVRTPRSVDMDMTIGAMQLVSIGNHGYTGTNITKDSDLFDKNQYRKKVLFTRMQ